MHHPDRGTGFEGIKNAVKVRKLSRWCCCRGTIDSCHSLQLSSFKVLMNACSCSQDHLPGTDRHRHRNQDAGDNLKEVLHASPSINTH